MWFWEVSPRYWTFFQWGIMALAICLVIAVIIFGCGIESFIDLIL